MINIFTKQEYETERPTERPIAPTITVMISSPVIQIIDVGETVRLNCSAHHNIKRVSIYIYNIFFLHIKIGLFSIRIDSNHSHLA